MSWCCILATASCAIVILYSLLEVHYFLRMSLTVILARFVKKKTHILDTTIVNGICFSTDIDTLLYHMNNARYLRELDFARVDFYERTSLYRTIVSKGGAVVQGAATIRYRRFIRPFSLFRITSRIIYWDDQSVFMEHRFISAKDNFIHCIAICRQRIIDCSAEDVMATLISSKNGNLQNANVISPTPSQNVERMENGNVDNVSDKPQGAVVAEASVSVKLKPEMPLEIAKWMDYNEISSKNLRNGC